MNASVYWLYSADGQLLYVGLTCAPKARMKHHQSTKPWWSDVAYIVINASMPRSDASAIETEQIRRFQPLHNVADKYGLSAMQIAHAVWVAERRAAAHRPLAYAS